MNAFQFISIKSTQTGALLFCLNKKKRGRIPGDGSMFKKVEDHEIRIYSQKDEDWKHEDRLKALEDNCIRLENTVMTENHRTRKTMMD